MGRWLWSPGRQGGLGGPSPCGSVRTEPLSLSTTRVTTRLPVRPLPPSRRRGGRAVAVQGDVGKVGDIQRLFDAAFEHFGKLDILVNNAGVMFNKPVADVTEEEYDRIFAVNVKGTFFACRQAAKRMADGGRIINFSSSTTAMMLPTYGAYVATKGAVEQMSHVLAKELGPRGITVNVVSPGPTDTELFGRGKTERDKQRFAQMTALGRLGQPRTSPTWWLCWSATRLAGSPGRTSVPTAGLSEHRGVPAGGLGQDNEGESDVSDPVAAAGSSTPRTLTGIGGGHLKVARGEKSEHRFRDHQDRPFRSTGDTEMLQPEYCLCSATPARSAGPVLASSDMRGPTPRWVGDRRTGRRPCIRHDGTIEAG